MLQVHVHWCALQQLLTIADSRARITHRHEFHMTSLVTQSFCPLIESVHRDQRKEYKIEADHCILTANTPKYKHTNQGGEILSDSADVEVSEIRLYMPEKSVRDLEDQLDGAQVSILNKDELITQKTMENNFPTEDENIEQLAPVQHLQERETSLIYQNENYKLLQCERENEHLLGDIYTLRVNETNLYKVIKSLTNEMRHLEALREKNEGEIHRLREEVWTLKRQLDDAEDVLRDRDEKTRELMDKGKVEVQQLIEALRDRQEHDESVRADLTRLESLREKDAKENEDLKAAMEELQSKHDDALQSRIIADLNHFIAHHVLGR